MERSVAWVAAAAAAVALGGCATSPADDDASTSMSKVSNPFDVLEASMPSVPSAPRDVREPMPVAPPTPTVSVVTATTSAPPAPPATPAPPAPVTGDTVGIGDSVMLGAQPALSGLGVDIDAVVSRQFWDAPAVVAAHAAPGRSLVIHIGTNGNPTPAQFDAMMSAAAPADRVFLLTVRMPRVWEAASNEGIVSGLGRWPGEAVLIDWYAASADRPDWFEADGVHLTSAGAAAYAGLIASAVG